MKEKEIKEIIKKGESETVEFKSSLSELKEALRSLAAFSWSNGGTVIFGISRTGKIVGLDVGKGAIESLANSIKQNTDPKLYPSIKVFRVENKDIISVEIEKVSEEPVLAFGIAYKRIGRSTHQISRGEYNRIILEKHKEELRFDNKVCKSASLEDIDKEKVRWFLRKAQAERNFDVEPETPLKESLRRLKLLKDGKLTNAAVLLFGKEPQKFFLQARVRCARFKGTEAIDFIDMKILDGNIIDQVDKAENFILSHIKKAAKIVMFKREEVWEYPPDALREAIVNAICHRDYFISGDIKISIFDDRIEISNPGKLPEPLTPPMLKKKHDSILRNPLIANGLFLIKNIEQWGKGTNKIVKWCVEHGLKEPDFEEIAGGFEVVFYAPGDILKLIPEKGKVNLKELGLNERQIEALRLMVNESKKFTIQEYSNQFKINEKTSRRDLQQLIINNFVEKIGKTKGAYFQSK